MTDVEGLTVQDDWRAALAAQLEEQFSYAAQYATVVLDWDEEADELMPIVRRIVAGESARELRAAARRLKTALLTDTHGLPMDVVHDLRARADRLDSTPDHGKA